MFDAGKVLLHLPQQVRFGPALQHFHDERATWSKQVQRQVMRRFAQGHYSNVVRSRVTRRRGGHIAQHGINRSAKSSMQFFEGVLSLRVELKNGGAINGFHLQKIQRKDGTLMPIPVDPLQRHLGPRARRRTEVKHPPARPQELKSIVQFDEFVGSTRAVPPLISGPYKRIVELAL